MVKSPAFQFYIQDFLSGVKLFTAEETGAYILLLIEQWDNGFILNEDKYLKKITGISKKKLEKVLKKFSSDDKGHLKNIRLEAERTKQLEWRKKSSMGGKTSAEKRKTKSNHPSTTLEPPLKNSTNQTATLHSSSSISSYEDKQQSNQNRIDATKCEEIKNTIKADQLFLEQRCMENRIEMNKALALVDQFFIDKRDDRQQWENESDLRRNLRLWFPKFLNSKDGKQFSGQKQFTVSTGRKLQ